MDQVNPDLIEAVELIRSAPKTLLTPVRVRVVEFRTMERWSQHPTLPPHLMPCSITQRVSKLRYLLSFTEVAQRFEIVDERIENEKPDTGHKALYLVLSLRKMATVY